jgi:hypothetical protein
MNHESKTKDFFGEISGHHGGEYGILRHVVWWKFTDVLEAITSSP